MMIYISCAKTMTARSKKLIPFTTIPEFYNEAAYNIRWIERSQKATCSGVKKPLISEWNVPLISEWNVPLISEWNVPYTMIWNVPL